MEDPADRQPLDGSWAVAVPAAATLDTSAAATEAPPPPRVKAADRVLSGMEVFLCSGFPTQLLLAVALQALGWSPFGPSGTLSLRYIATLSLVDTLIIVLLAHLFLVSRGDRPGLVYFGDRRVGRETLLGVLVLPAILLGIATLSLALRHFAPWLHNVPENPLEALMRDRLGLAVFAVVVVLAGGVREEVQRAFVLHRFTQHLGGPRVGLWLFSVMFGVGHLLQGYDAAILTAVLGLVWGALYLQRGSIVAPMVSHSLFNLAEVVKQALLA